MKFDIEKPQGVWFDFPGGGRVQIKLPTTDDYIRIDKEATDNKPFLHQEEGKPPVVLNHVIPDYDKRAKLLADCTIPAWEGFFDSKEQPIECTPKNKTLLMRLEDPTFRDFVNEKIKLLEEAAKAKKGEELKNS